jgi:hypothetical protein
MRRHLLLLIALAAVPPVLCAQSSQFGVRGLGLPGRQQSARAMGSAGAFAFFDGESSVSPASIGYIGQLTATFTALGDYRSTSTPSGEASIRNPRFPQFLVGGPIRRFPMTLALSYSNYTTRDYSLSFPATIILRDQPVDVTDTIESRGGINDFRLAAAYRLGQRWVIGAGAHIITGSNRVEARRTFSDTLYARSIQRAELSFAGFGVSLGVVGQIGNRLTVSAMARSDGRVSMDLDSVEVTKIDLPISLGAAARLRVTPKLHAGGQVLYRRWGSADEDLRALGGTGAFNTVEAAGGLEFTPDPRRPFRRPIRFGVRYAQLPFPLTSGEQPTEFGVTLGSGFSFAQDRAVIALALERAWRDQSDAYSETAWIVTAGVTVRP